jgi:hypothetical protein
MDKFKGNRDTIEVILWVAAMFAAVYIPLLPML